MVCCPGQPPLHGAAHLESRRGILGPRIAQVRCVGSAGQARGLAIVVPRDPGQRQLCDQQLRRSGTGWHMVGHHSGPVPSLEQERPAALPRRRARPPQAGIDRHARRESSLSLAQLPQRRRREQRLEVR